MGKIFVYTASDANWLSRVRKISFSLCALPAKIQVLVCNRSNWTSLYLSQ